MGNGFVELDDQTTLLRLPSQPENAQVVKLLLQLLNVLSIPSDSQEPQPQAEDSEEVLFSVTLDDLCYTLTCTPAAPLIPEASLSPRESEIARLIAKGLPNKAIASVLDISVWTVSTHLRRIFIKLEVNSRAEMVAKLMKSGMLTRKS